MKRFAGFPGRIRPAYWSLVALLTILPCPAAATERLIVGGLLDGEAWNTDSGSVLLSRNEGKTAGVGRLRLWEGVEIAPGFHFFALEEFENEGEGEASNEFDQAFLRYDFRAPLRLRIEAGRIAAPVGSFAARHASNVNPLVGEPDTYDVGYPYGLQLSAVASYFDFRVAVVSLPLVNGKYVPKPTAAYRPAINIGVTPVTGLRFGAFATRGPYLNRHLQDLIPAGAGWRDFEQQILGFEVQFSRGYLEINGELALSGYEVPTQTAAVHGKAAYLDVKYTWSPRFFTAIRLEQNSYVFVRPISSSFWLGRPVNFYDAEAGLGYRLGPDTLVKVSYRRDHWSVDDSLKPFLPNGHALALQLSHSFDVLSWFERRR